MARRRYAGDEIDNLSDAECREIVEALAEHVPGTLDSIRRGLGRDRGYPDDDIVGANHGADVTDRRRARDRRLEDPMFDVGNSLGA